MGIESLIGILLLMGLAAHVIEAIQREDQRRKEAGMAGLEFRMDNLIEFFRNVKTATTNEGITELITRYFGR